MKTSKIEYGVLALIILGVSVRFLIGLQSPHSLAIGPGFVESDLAVVGLMAKHTLERGEFPFFFWGQNWFGGLEACLHGVSFLIFGVSPWAMRMTTLFLFSLFSLLTYLIGRDLHNDRVGFWAALWCVAAPMTLTQFSLIPQTHYIETPVLGSLVLWIAIRLTMAKTPKSKRFLYLALGAMAGLSWWTTPLIIYYLAGISVYLLFKERLRSIRLGLVLALPAFILGALPFFIYYALDPNSSVLGMGEGFNWKRLGFGLHRFFFEVGPWILDIPLYKQFGSWATWAVSGFYLYVLIYYIVKVVKGKRDEGGGILILLFLSLGLIYASSVHATRFKPHYVIALVSFFPVACGFSVWQVSSKWRRVTLPIYVIILLAQVFFIWQWGVHEVPSFEARAKDFLNLIDFLKAKGLTKVHGNYFMGSAEISFQSHEAVICANPMEERYRPYELLLESAENPAYIQGGHIKKFLNQIGGNCEEDQIGPFHVDYDFHEPERQYLQINPGGIKVDTMPESQINRDVLDRDMETVWKSPQKKTPGMWIQFDLGKEYSLGLVRLWNRGEDHGEYGLDTSVEVSRDGSVWEEVLGRISGDYYYWSGPRIYYWEWGYRWEARFGPVMARYVRIRQYEESFRSSWKIAEAYIYEDVGARAAMGDEGEQEVIDRVKELGLENVYADRWMSARVREASNGNIKTVDVFTYAAKHYRDRLKSRVIQWGPKAGFILESQDVPEFERMMKEEGIELTHESYGRWEIFYFSHWGKLEESLKGNTGWWWMGLGAVRTNHKERSEYFGNLGRLMEAQEKWQEALHYDKKALEEHGNNTRVRERMVQVLRKLGREEEAERAEETLLVHSVPIHEQKVSFEGGIDFLGYTTVKDEAAAGEVLPITYYWRLRDESRYENLSVFVHVEGNGRLFQGDHRFLEGQENLRPILEGEVFRQEEKIKIPEGSPKGKYEIRIGLFDSKSGKRRKVFQTELQHKGGRVEIGTLEIVR